MVVVDSFSTDRTVEIARRRAPRCISTPSPIQAAQLQWALDTIAIDSDWIIRVDCDEYLEPALIDEIEGDGCPIFPADVTAIDLPA